MEMKELFKKDLGPGSPLGGMQTKQRKVKKTRAIVMGLSCIAAGDHIDSAPAYIKRSRLKS